MFAACGNRNEVTLENEARWAMARRYAATKPVPNFLPHLYLDALSAVQPERLTVLRWRRTRA